MQDATQPPAAPEPGVAERAGEVDRALTVLVVDDEPGVLRAVARILARQGYRVLSAGDGAEALHVARAHAGPIALLLTDVVMPGMEGRELAERFSGAFPGVPIVFMSGKVADVALREEIAEGGAGFLSKPFSVEQLVSMVEGAAGRRPA